MNQPLCFSISHKKQFKAWHSTALVIISQLRSNSAKTQLVASVDLLRGLHLSTNLELKLEARPLLKHHLLKRPPLFSPSSRAQKCCPLQTFSFSSLSWWENDPVWIFSFSSEVQLVYLVYLIQILRNSAENNKCCLMYVMMLYNLSDLKHDYNITHLKNMRLKRHF